MTAATDYTLAELCIVAASKAFADEGEVLGTGIGVIPRLSDIGILPDIMAGNIIGVVAQRLVRKLCPHCRRARAPEAFELRLLSDAQVETVPELYEPVGCPQCDFRGYRGRMAVMELIRMDADLDELIARRATFREVRNMARAKGFRSLADDGMRRVIEGLTTLDELARVVDLTDRMSTRTASSAA